jgi:hypothetical protein
MDQDFSEQKKNIPPGKDLIEQIEVSMPFEQKKNSYIIQYGEEDPVSLEMIHDEEYENHPRANISIMAIGAVEPHKYKIWTAYDMFIKEKKVCPISNRILELYELNRIELYYQFYTKYRNHKQYTPHELLTKLCVEENNELYDYARGIVNVEDIINFCSRIFNNDKPMTRKDSERILLDQKLKLPVNSALIRGSSIGYGSNICRIFVISQKKEDLKTKEIKKTHLGYIHVHGYGISSLVNMQDIFKETAKIPDKYEDLKLGKNREATILDYLSKYNENWTHLCKTIKYMSSIKEK